LIFQNRTDAGEQLAQALMTYKGQSVVVYALPRGGVVLGVEVARALEAPLDLLVVRKIGHPHQLEYAIGAVAEDGYLVTNPDERGTPDEGWFRHAVAAELKEAHRRRALFLQGRRPFAVRGKIAIIVDDGLATGMTMLAAIHEIRKREPKQIIVAVHVAAAETANKLRSVVDDLVVLHIPEWLDAIGAFYQDFAQVTDDEVVALMQSETAGKVK
jgi:putative phosphoribosyl transferase